MKPVRIWSTRLSIALSLLFAGIAPAQAQKTPAVEVPASRWGTLEPVEILGDFTTFVGQADPKAGNTLQWYDVDTESHYLYTTTGQGLQIFDLANPESPSQSSYIYGWISGGAFPVWNYSDKDWYIKDLDVPEGNDSVLALGMEEQGIAIVDATSKFSPVVAYQGEVFVTGVHAAHVSGKDYAWALGGSVLLFDMTKAMGMNRCVDDADVFNLDHPAAPACAGVYKGVSNGLGTGWSSIDGTGNYLALGRGGPSGFARIYNVGTPLAPVQVAEVSSPSNAVGLWKTGSSMYLATLDRFGKTMSIYDATCALAGSCVAPLSAISTRTMTWPAGGPPQSVLSHLTVSKDGSKTYVYLGGEDLSACTPQREFLWDVSTPSSPQELTPQNHPGGYWGWYYQNCDNSPSPGGFNLVGPRAALVRNGLVYRAANSILDIHRIAGAVAPTADFSWTPAEVYPGTAVNFQDQSSGAPTTFSWSFAGGTPPTSAVASPSGVTFSSQGPHDVTLVVESAVGPSEPVTKTINVLNPTPVVASVTASPTSGYVCQPFTFTANGIGGQVPVTLSWELRNAAQQLITSAGNANPVTWTSIQSTPPGPYTATVTASNVAGSASKSATVTVNALDPLPGDGAWAPVNDSFNAGVVTFHANAPGATTWSWDFGDSGGVFTAPSSDPINGPNPTHSYAAIGDYTVRVKVSNCVQSERTSSGLPVHISQITPLAAVFSLAAPDFECQIIGYCSYTAGAPIAFADASTGAEFWDYDWNGDGTFEDTGHPSPVLTHTYAAATASQFTPKLKVRRGASEFVVANLAPFAIKILPAVPPSITVSGTSSGVVGTNYNYSASASNCTPASGGWSWTVTGGGSGTSTSNTIQVSWATTGGKSVSASNSACGSASGTKSVTIGSSGGGGGAGGGGGGGGGGGTGLVASYNYSPGAPKAGENVTFTSTSTGAPTSTFWTWGDGTPNSEGTSVTHQFAQPGNYSVALQVSKSGSGTGCEFGICTAQLIKTVVVASNGPPPPVAAFTVSGGGSCISELGFEICSAATGQPVTFTDVSTGTVETRSWDFGDGGTATDATANHAFAAPGTYQVALMVQGSGKSSSTSKTFNVTGPAVAKDALVLTWFQRSNGALAQTSDFYVYNPGNETLTLTVTYMKRGLPNPQPPHKELNIAAHATLFVADALKVLFGLNDGSGFLYFTWEGVSSPYPVITGTNNTKLADGTTFGQSFAAVKVARSISAPAAATAVPDQDVVGLSDVSGDSFSTFGVSNPFDAPANIELQFTNAAGLPLRPALPVTIARNSQILYQIVDIRALGIKNLDNYRLTVKALSGGSVLPFAKKLREGSQDQAYVPAVKTYQKKVILLGVYSGDTVRGNRWSTDAVLFNPTASELVVEARFIPVGVTSEPSPIATFHLQPKESRRLVDVLKTEWSAQGVNGYITFETKNGGSGPYAGIMGEIYDYSNPKKIYGNVFGALSEDEAAGPGQSLALVGLMQNAAYSTTLWLYNPGPGPAQAELIYRASSDGHELARTLTGSPEGVMRLVNPKGFPEAVKNLSEPFTVEIHLNFGRMMASGLMVSSATKDPTYVVGVAH